MKDIQIIPIREEYIEGFHACFDAVARERTYLARVEAPPIDSVRAFVQRIIAGGVPQFVALEGDTVIGWCDVIPNSIEGFTHVGRLGMGVQKDYRGKGIGEKLARATIGKAKKKGLEKVVLSVFASNLAAIKLYEKIGFKVEGVKKKARKIDDNYDDMIEMALFLDAYTE